MKTSTGRPSRRGRGHRTHPSRQTPVDRAGPESGGRGRSGRSKNTFPVSNKPKERTPCPPLYRSDPRRPGQQRRPELRLLVPQRVLHRDHRAGWMLGRVRKPVEVVVVHEAEMHRLRQACTRQGRAEIAEPAPVPPSIPRQDPVGSDIAEGVVAGESRDLLDQIDRVARDRDGTSAQSRSAGLRPRRPGRSSVEETPPPVRVREVLTEGPSTIESDSVNQMVRPGPRRRRRCRASRSPPVISTRSCARPGRRPQRKGGIDTALETIRRLRRQQWRRDIHMIVGGSQVAASIKTRVVSRTHFAVGSSHRSGQRGRTGGVGDDEIVRARACGRRRRGWSTCSPASPV